MEDIFQKISDIFSFDPGNRCLPGNVPLPNLEKLTQQLMNSQRIVIITGFPIKGTGTGETDGPAGAAHIAYALTKLGKKVWVVTDMVNMPIVLSACATRAPMARVLGVPRANAVDCCRQILSLTRPTHIISIERPGKGLDGHFHNMPGAVIDDLIADTDTIFTEGKAVKIAIGDGGNEIGMEDLRPQIERCIKNGRSVCTTQRADFPLVAGVSNWWGWGIAALLSAQSGRNLMPSDEDERDVLEAIRNTGGVDGVTRDYTLSVDGLSLAENLEVLHKIKAAVQK